MNKYLTQVETTIGPPINGLGPIGDPSSRPPSYYLTVILSISIGLITLIAFIWFVFLLITGAIGVMSAGGDKAQIEAARKRITNGVIGVIIVIAGMFIAEFVATILGVPGILNIPEMITRLSP